MQPLSGRLCYTSSIAHLVLIDGHHLMYRAYWAIPRTMVTSKGEQVNTVFGIASMLIQILQTEHPDSLLFCFDEGEETFRHKEYAEYKAGRAETPDDFYSQIPRVFALIDAFGFKRVSLSSHEADDLLCAYARNAEKEGDTVTIVSGDRDVLQLASVSVRIAVPHKGYGVPEYLDPDAVKKKYGVTPRQIPSYKGLVGDSSDNLKGVAGIGPKAAASLLTTYDVLEDVYGHLSEVKGAWKEKLEKDRESAFFSKRMAELVCDFPLPIPPAQLTIAAVNLDRAFAMCRELEFILIAKRLTKLMESEYGRAHFTSPDMTPASGKEIGEIFGRQGQSESAQLSLL